LNLDSETLKDLHNHREEEESEYAFYFYLNQNPEALP